jgi:tryptophanyl-tRNA synthetase
MSTKRVLTGMRTTGQLHLGHYVGALKQWLEVQNTGEYECFFLLADIQALTTHADQPELLTKSVRDVVLDWLAVGLDPSRPNVHFVLQSQVPERAELSIAFSMIAKYSEVMRNPTLKSEFEDLGKNATIGFIAYPVDQVADIYMVSPTPPEPNDRLLVPVGEDQVPHLEYARILARRFNKKYGEVFVPCRNLVGEVGRLVGIDGQIKMSKSKGNTINLADDEKTVEKQVMKMFTDPKRIHADTPGETENNPVFVYHRAFNPDEGEIADLTERYQKGKVGDVEVKRRLAAVLNNFLDPIRERREKFKREDLREILLSGTKVARKACVPVMESVREKMHLVYPS